MVMSSANWVKFSMDEELYISLIYNKNSSGSNVEPSGKPILTVFISDINSLILTKYFLLDIKLIAYLGICP